MRLHDLVAASNGVAATSGRLEKIGRLSALLRGAAASGPHEVEVAVAFLSGSLRQGRIGLGPSQVWQARGTSPAPDPTLTLHDADSAFSGIAGLRGAGSASRRAGLLRDLMSRATTEEQDFLARLILGELRQGALEGVLVDAVARAAGIRPDRVRRAVMLRGDLGPVAVAALAEGEAALARFDVQLFRPVQPMLAEAAEDVEDAIERLHEAALEYKLDGARIQVHKAGGDVRVFTRNLRDVTAAVPEVVEHAAALPSREAILDGEVLSLRSDGSPQPFQVTMRRFGRKLDVEALRQELPLTPFFFDALQAEGRSLLDVPQSQRFDTLAALVPAQFVVPHERATTAEQADLFLAEALRRGHEGVMAKAPDSLYAAGRRGRAWLKVKVAASLDLVILAAEWGNGRRRGWLSNLHLGARDPEQGGFVMLGKTFKGLTDEMLEWQTKTLLALEIARTDYTVFVRPELVVEIAFNDIQESSQYPGGMALRFARVKRYRQDKPASEADTIGAVREIFRKKA